MSHCLLCLVELLAAVTSSQVYTCHRDAPLRGVLRLYSYMPKCAVSAHRFYRISRGWNSVIIPCHETQHASPTPQRTSSHYYHLALTCTWMLCQFNVSSVTTPHHESLQARRPHIGILTAKTSPSLAAIVRSGCVQELSAFSHNLLSTRNMDGLALLSMWSLEGNTPSVLEGDTTAADAFSLYSKIVLTARYLLLSSATDYSFRQGNDMLSHQWSAGLWWESNNKPPCP